MPSCCVCPLRRVFDIKPLLEAHTEDGRKAITPEEAKRMAPALADYLQVPQASARCDARCDAEGVVLPRRSLWVSGAPCPNRVHQGYLRGTERSRLRGM